VEAFVYSVSRLCLTGRRCHRDDCKMGVPAGEPTIQHLPLREMLEVPFPLPPLPEQRRIVAKLEELFTRLDAGVAGLKVVQAQLKRYRASVLKAAVEGRLVPTEAELARAEGRDYEPADRLLVSTQSIHSSHNKRAGRLWGAGVVPELTEGEKMLLPEGWSWVKVRDLGLNPDEVVQVGPMSMKSCEFSSEGVPVLNVGCVQWGYFNERKLDYLPTGKAVPFDRYRIQPGDVLFTRSGTVGRCAVATERMKKWLMTFHLLRARPTPDKCDSLYLRIVFEGASHIRRQTRDASIGTTRAGFNTNLLASLDIPLPPLAEQHRIVAEVERRLSVVEELETTIAAELTRADRLRQSILKRAFEGKLVPQDPTDEPASVLLARITAERAGTERVPRGRRRLNCDSAD
jgi:type I restriction enzyme S subunit